MSNCGKFQPLLSRLDDREAEPGEAIAVARHLSECTSCRILRARERRLAELLDENLEDVLGVDAGFLRDVMDRLPEGPPPRRKRRGLKLAIALGGVGLCGALVARLGSTTGGGIPGLPAFDVHRPDDAVRGLQTVAGLIAELLNFVGTGLAPVLRLLPGSAELALGLGLPLGALLLLTSTGFLFAARQLLRTKIGAR